MVSVVIMGMLLSPILVLLLCWWLNRIFEERKARMDARMFREMEKEIDHEERGLDKMERVVRQRQIGGLLSGEKCKGCRKTVPREEMKEAGEDSRGRPIYLCAQCRELMGIETGTESPG